MRFDMDKKNILSNATSAVAKKKPNFFVRAWRRIVRQCSAFWKWLCNQDRMMFFNIVLLALVIAMMVAMICSVKRVGGAKKIPGARNVEYIEFRAKNGRPIDFRPNLGRPTVVVSRNGQVLAGAPRRTAAGPRQKITLPLKRNRPVARKTVAGGIVIDGNTRDGGLRAMTTVNGDLYLQNMRTYTLPCGTSVRGNLFLRNVRLLKFCDPAAGVPSFYVAGNIYVSSNSSFGPIPKNAYLNGQIVF
jgi:hypothetical protein